MAAVRVTCKVTPVKNKGDVFEKEYEVKSGDVHLKSLSSTLKMLQKEVNEVLTVIVDKEKADQSSAGRTDNDGIVTIYFQYYIINL